MASPPVVPETDWSCSSIECAALAKRWTSLSHLRSAGADTPVEVAASTDGFFEGSVETHETLSMTFGTFLDQLEEVGDVWHRKPSRLHLHLAQCPLSLLPKLQEEVDVPQCVLSMAASKESIRTNLWFCLSPGHSALHYDCFDNLLLVLRGVKRFLLLPPSATRLLAPRAAHTLSANRSALTRGARVEELITELLHTGVGMRLEVRAGHTLFIPSGWWHAVDSPAEVTLAVNFWWTRPVEWTRRSADTALAPRHSRGPAALNPQYLVRCAFEQAVHDEADRMLRSASTIPRPRKAPPLGAASHDTASQCPPSLGVGSSAGSSAPPIETLGLANASAASRDDGGHGGGDVGECTCHGDGNRLSRESRPSAPVSELTARLLDAADEGDGPDGPALLHVLLTTPALALCRALANGAEREPVRLRGLLMSQLGPAGAHALGLRLQEAQGAACAGCSTAAALNIEASLRVVGDAAARAVQRQRLLALAETFMDSAARSVLRDVLGLANLVPDATTFEVKRRRLDS